MQLLEKPKKLLAFFEKYEGPIQSFFMLLGFSADMAVLHRADVQWQNIAMAVYLGIAALGITLVNAQEGGLIQWSFMKRLRLWIPIIIQYALGGLFSAFVALYSKSASLKSR